MKPKRWKEHQQYGLVFVRSPNSVFKEILSQGVADAFRQGSITNFHQSVPKLESKNLSEKLSNMLIRPF